MHSDMTIHKSRRDRVRYAIPEDQDRAERKLSATIRYDDSSPIPIRIGDLSRMGAGFRLTQQPRTGSDVLLTLNHRGTELRFRAKLKWGKAVSGGEYAAGCEFAAPLGQDFLANLSDAQVLEPAAARKAGWVRVIVRSEDTPAARVEGEIINYSDDGLCLATLHQFVPGSVLLCEVADGHRPRTVFLARIAWERPEGEYSLHGCTFADEEGATALNNAIERMRSRVPTESDDTPSPRRAGILGRLGLVNLLVACPSLSALLT